MTPPRASINQPLISWPRHLTLIGLLSLMAGCSITHADDNKQGRNEDGTSNRTTPPTLDSDSDGLTDHDEINIYGTDWENEITDVDTDNDGLDDGEDGWPHDKNLAVPRVSENYVLVDLSSHLPHPDSNAYNGTPSIHVDDFGGVMLASHQDIGNNTTYTTKYYNWLSVAIPPEFNGEKPNHKEITTPSWMIANYDVGVELSRNGILSFNATCSVFVQASGDEIGTAINEELLSDFLNNYTSYIELHNEPSTVSQRIFFPELFDFAYNKTETKGGIEGFSVKISNEGTDALKESVRTAETVYLAPAQPEGWILIDQKEWIDKKITHNAQYYDNGSAVGSQDSHDHLLTSKFGTSLIQTRNADGTYSYTAGAHTHNQPVSLVSALGKDIITKEDGTQYSLDGGVKFHDFQVWDAGSKALVSAQLKNTSDDLIILSGGNKILINQLSRSIEDLVQNGDGWSNFKLTDINSHGMIVGTAEQDNTKKVIALLKVDIEVPKVDSAGNEISGEFVSAQELKVGKMEGALEKDGLGFVKNKLNIDQDVDRFYINIPGLSGVSSVSVKIETEDNSNYGGDYNDNATEIELEPAAGGNGYRSKSMLLVSDEVDDIATENDLGADDQDLMGDRTHKVQLGGKLKVSAIKINGDEFPVSIEADVPVKKELDITFVFLRKDDVSVVSSGDIAEHFKQLRECFAQIGIKVNLAPIVYANIEDMSATGVSVPFSVDENGEYDGIFNYSGIGQVPTADEKLLFESFGSTGNLSDIRVFYVEKMDAYGLTYSEAYCSLIGKPSWAHNIVLSKRTVEDNKIFTLAHEVGHALSNDAGSISEVHHDSRDNLMYYSTSTTNELRSGKRLTNEQESEMYNETGLLD